MDGSLVPQDIKLPAERMKTAKGLGNIAEEDRIIPRLKIMQPLSPEVNDELAKPGEFLNSISKKAYGKAVPFIPVIWWKSRIYWARRDEGGDMLCNAKDAVTGTTYGACIDCEYSKWNNKEPPACTAVINILGLIMNELVAVSFMKTSYQAGKQLINLFNYKKVDIFNFQYELYNEQEENQLGKFWVMKYRDFNTAIDDATYKVCNAIYDNFAKIKEKVEEVKVE